MKASANIQQIPEFKRHLARRGISFEQWQAEAKSISPEEHDLTSELLELARRRNALRRKVGSRQFRKLEYRNENGN